MGDVTTTRKVTKAAGYGYGAFTLDDNGRPVDRRKKDNRRKKNRRENKESERKGVKVCSQ